ncbi:MAG: ATP-binding protein [Byssovorax sp.]
MKHNPAFLTQDELIRSFVVRHTDLELIVERLHDQGEGPSQHILLIGPRGIGKTTLALRVAAAVRSDPELAERWYPLVFGEESYEVGTAAELWLEALLRLAEQTKDARWKAAYEELRAQRDEKRLYTQALARLMDFADERKARLLVVVENLNMILGEQLDDHDGWDLRHTLQNEPRVMLLATATSRFDEIDNVDKAMYDLFWTYDLKPLGTSECRALWAAVSGHEIDEHRIRPIEILTGGNPRLLAIFSAFGAKLALRELMSQLTQLVDDHTSYFKGNLERLPAAERKVYVALADAFSPATAREVAAAARVDVNKASALLHRLVGRGAVIEVKQEGRKISYQVAERMYNIYHLMRRGGQGEERIKRMVDFMIHFYDNHEERHSPTPTQVAPGEAAPLADGREPYAAALIRALEASPSPGRLAETKLPYQRSPETPGRAMVVPSNQRAYVAAEYAALAPAVHLLLGGAAALSIDNRDLLDMLISAAAAGHAEQALALLLASPVGAAFEPLVVALQTILHHPCDAPHEIVEIARDIIERIEARRAAFSTAEPPPVVPRPQERSSSRAPRARRAPAKRPR